uniref:Uncharacterized protein n=1 Tax=Mantoniella antarctica TaxID=81844 RepID=A0A7S0SEG6_9CHLO
MAAVSVGRCASSTAAVAAVCFTGRAHHRAGFGTSRASHAHSRGGRATCNSASSEPSASSSSSNKCVEVITFDLDDTLWPTMPVVSAANEAFVSFCQERIPGFPDCAGVNEYMKAIRKEREQASEVLGERHYPLSFASLRIAGGYRAAVELGCPESDAIAVVSRGYHIAWIPARGAAAKHHLFDGVVESLRNLRQQYPCAAIGTITNGLGSAEGAGLGEFFDFEISADALMDEMMIHGDDARKPATFPFELAMKYARAHSTPWSGEPSRWVHVGDDLLNDCKAAKVHSFRTVHVAHPDVVPYQPGGGGGYPGDPARDETALDLQAIVDAKVTSVLELPGVLAAWNY